MVSTAYLFNGYDCYPENGVHKFYYNFSIRGVIAVAPTVDQYMPAGHEVELENVNYLVCTARTIRTSTSSWEIRSMKM